MTVPWQQGVKQKARHWYFHWRVNSCEPQSSVGRVKVPLSRVFPNETVGVGTVLCDIHVCVNGLMWSRHLVGFAKYQTCLVFSAVHVWRRKEGSP